MDIKTLTCLDFHRKKWSRGLEKEEEGRKRYTWMDARGSDMEDAGGDAGVSKMELPRSPSADDADANNGSTGGETHCEDKNEDAKEHASVSAGDTEDAHDTSRRSTRAGDVDPQMPIDACSSDMEDAGDDSAVGRIAVNNGSSDGETHSEYGNKDDLPRIVHCWHIFCCCNTLVETDDLILNEERSRAEKFTEEGEQNKWWMLAGVEIILCLSCMKRPDARGCSHGGVGGMLLRVSWIVLVLFNLFFWIFGIIIHF